MKIRTITAGINLIKKIKYSNLRPIVEFLKKAKEKFESYGSIVQSIRLSTQPWCEYLKGSKVEEIIENIIKLENFCKENEIDFMSIGTIDKAEYIEIIPTILKNTTITSCSVNIGDKKNGINYELLKKSSRTIIEISKLTNKGIGNFSFAVIINCPSDIPFFPASYHKGKPCFSIGTESGDLIMKAFRGSKGLLEARNNLKHIFKINFNEIDRIAKSLNYKNSPLYKGIDISPAPSLKEEESVALAFENLLKDKFGKPGTLAIAGMITDVINEIKVKKCGYCGLMLPILEDAGLSKRYKEETFTISNLLDYSAICGTGLDCIPLSGNVKLEEIEGILLDLAMLSVKLSKPLSARLLPCPGKKAGELTEFNSPYLIDTVIRKVG
jgi:hypothetical protein